MNLKQTYNSGKLLVGGKAKCFILLLPENIRKYGKLVNVVVKKKRNRQNEDMAHLCLYILFPHLYFTNNTE